MSDDGAMTLGVFLTARLDEDERVAQAALDGTREPRHHAECSKGCDSIHFTVAGGDDEPGAEALGAHIVRHHPARVLAEVAAKRAIVREYVEARDYDHGGEMRCFGHEEGLEEAVTLLAQPYADHPDFDPAWRVP